MSDKSLNVNQNVIGYSMAVHAILTVSLLHGTNQSVETVQNVISSWLRRKSVVVVNKSFVVMVTMKKKRLSKLSSLNFLNSTDSSVNIKQVTLIRLLRNRTLLSHKKEKLTFCNNVHFKGIMLSEISQTGKEKY